MADQTLTLPDLQAPVEVLRDRWGVSHVFAQNLHDLYLAQGYVTASDRLFQMEVMLRTSAGRLSELFGEATLATDRWTRLTGGHLAAARMTGLDELSVLMGSAFATGVHAFISGLDRRPAEYELVDADPWFPSPQEAPAAIAGTWLAMSLLPENWDMELLRTAILERAGWELMSVLCPATGPESGLVAAAKPTAAAARSAVELLRHAPLPPAGLGSNSWVVAGSRSVTGKPLLANDPHQPFAVPSLVYEIGLHAPGFDVSGIGFPFSPGVVVGHTPATAWGITNATADSQDLYLERLSADRSAALYEGRWEPTTTRHEAIGVRGYDQPVRFDVVETRHGPVVDEVLWPVADLPVRGVQPEHTYALRWTGADATYELSLVHRLAAARDFAAAREVLRGWSLFGANVVWADAGGGIGYQCAGRFPRRPRSDGAMPVPGWTGDDEWDGLVDFDELPWTADPDSGYLVTANQCMYDWTYPHVLGTDFAAPYRARRAAELVAAVGRHSVESFATIQRDNVSLLALEVLGYLRAIAPADAGQERALACLATWNGDMASDSVAATVYAAWVQQVMQDVLEPALGTDLAALYAARRGAFALPALLAYPPAALFGAGGAAARDDALRGALGRALAGLRERLGEDMDAWRWGDLHRLALVHQVVGLSGTTDPEQVRRFTAGDVAMPGDAATVNNAGHAFAPDFLVRSGTAWRHVIDLADVDASIGITSVGQSSDPASPHFADLLALRAAQDYHPLPLSRAAVAAVTEQRTTLSAGPSPRSGR